MQKKHTTHDKIPPSSQCCSDTRYIAMCVSCVERHSAVSLLCRLASSCSLCLFHSKSSRPRPGVMWTLAKHHNPRTEAHAPSPTFTSLIIYHSSTRGPVDNGPFRIHFPIRGSKAWPRRGAWADSLGSRRARSLRILSPARLPVASGLFQACSTASERWKAKPPPTGKDPGDDRDTDVTVMAIPGCPQSYLQSSSLLVPSLWVRPSLPSTVGLENQRGGPQAGASKPSKR